MSPTLPLSYKVQEEELVRIYHANRTQGSLIHGEYKLSPGGFQDVPKSIADIWLTHKNGEMPIATTRADEITPALIKAEEVNAELSAENKTQAAQIANLEKLVADLRAAGAGGAIPPKPADTESEKVINVAPTPTPVAQGKPRK